ncbi:hypothetical protein Mal35_42780 [Gimesia maris]|uniref:hypothetical protein n=1 Tax=Gimesia maris TaxID=122 RepID=UPI00118CF6F7|nr:hypothetical protein [Gimesia maris]QDT80803.1 hypothetical protein Mal35_42780 [Gimesia maris]
MHQSPQRTNQIDMFSLDFLIIDGFVTRTGIDRNNLFQPRQRLDLFAWLEVAGFDEFPLICRPVAVIGSDGSRFLLAFDFQIDQVAVRFGFI